VSRSAARAEPTATATSLIIHLRLPFQLLLSPVFLWGWLLAGGRLGPHFVLAFVSFHVFLYGGATAFNSYYDRDEGPIGGLEHPPTVVPALLPFSLSVKAVGWLLAGLVNVPFFLVYGGFLLLSVTYSHPGVRLKARPWGSLLTVGLGQGVLAFAGAWFASRGATLGDRGPIALLGGAAATLLILGLYPLTQLFQVAEDAGRGDRTVAVAWGPRACFALSLACLAVGGLLMVAVVARLYGAVDAAVVGAGLAAQLAAVAWWARRFDVRRVLWNFGYVMRLNTAGAAGLAAYLGVRLMLPAG